MVVAGVWQALENGRRWSMVVAGECMRWRMGSAGGMVAGEWEALENGSRWRMEVAGEWESLENGSRWRMEVAGEWELPENALPGGTERGGA
jgi:hypothetical protein